MIEIREISDLKEAEASWRSLSPRRTIFDEWDFRYCFYKYDPLPLHFFVAYEGGSLVGLMPLQKHPEHGFEFFAEEPSEESRPFVKPGYEHIIPQLYAAIPGPAKCYDISGDDSFTMSLPLEDYKYVLPLAKIEDWEGYLKARLSVKKQRNLRAEMRKIEALEPEMTNDDRRSIEDVFALNCASFSDSYLQPGEERQGWADLLLLPYDWRLTAVKVGGSVVAASLSVVYNGTYFYLINGADNRRVPNIGKYLNRLNLERAISLGAEYWDAGLGDCNWKEAWHMDKVPQYLFKKE